jgi:hypothetical protein
MEALCDWTRSSTPGIRRLVLLTLVLGTHVCKLYSASTLILFLSASCSWDGGSRASAQISLNHYCRWWEGPWRTLIIANRDEEDFRPTFLKSQPMFPESRPTFPESRPMFRESLLQVLGRSLTYKLQSLIIANREETDTEHAFKAQLTNPDWYWIILDNTG